MFHLGMGLANAESQRQLSIQFGVSEKEIAALIKAIHDGLIGSVSGSVPEADEVERCWRSQLKVVAIAHPASEFLREFNAAHGLADSYTEIGQRAYTIYRGYLYEWFAQDSWKVNSTLTLN